jgi:hypothetical protein
MRQECRGSIGCTRRLVGNSIGILKEKCSCINHLCVQVPVFATNIFKCCVTLCNISCQVEPINDIGFDENCVIDEPPQQDEDDELPQFGVIHRREQLINHF